jgi:hypothetical protein
MTTRIFGDKTAFTTGNAPRKTMPPPPPEPNRLPLKLLAVAAAAALAVAALEFTGVLNLFSGR